ncbi:MAG TPA: hypothetical protein VN962_08230, partial [Polyangia bacterium]|nr:hypothetical protein [Polyangia bacterium]
VVLQMWAGDEPAALRLARLLADIEPARRDDMQLVLARRFDLPLSAESWDTLVHCGAKFPVSHIQVARRGTGHPAGCNALWSGAMAHLARTWRHGHLRRSALFFIEADGCPLRSDWASVLIAEHQASLAAGRRVTGALTRFPMPHFNGSLIAEASVWWDRASLHVTPPEQAWDLFHAAALLQEGRATSLIKNVYNARAATPEMLDALSPETAWVCNAKDASLIDWAERALVQPARTAPRWRPEPTPRPGPGMPYTP